MCYLLLFEFNTTKIKYDETQNNIYIPNIQYHIYKGGGQLTVHKQRPLGMTHWLYHKMEWKMMRPWKSFTK